jgi:hypothetical protein
MTTQAYTEPPDIPCPYDSSDRQDHVDAWHAGVDYARDVISWHPDWSKSMIDHEVQGGCSDLCCGNECTADSAYDGASKAVDQYFELHPETPLQKAVEEMRNARFRSPEYVKAKERVEALRQAAREDAERERRTA